MRITQTFVAGPLVAVLLLAGCVPATSGGPLGSIELDSALRPFDGCEALEARLRREALDRVTPYGVRGSLPVAADAVAESAAAAAPAAHGQRDGAFSTTNVQELGVDEADIVKTDGKSVFAVVDGVLRIVDARDERPRVTATLPLTGGWARDMLLHDDRLLVLGEGEPVALPRPEAPADDLSLEPTHAGRARLWLVDVGDPTAPAVLSTMTVDGALLSSRLSGPVARVVVRSMAWLPGMVTPGGGPEATARALAVNRARAERATAWEWLPQVVVDDMRPQPLVECTAVHSPPTTPDLGVVSVLSLDLTHAALTADRAQAVLGAGETVYASTDSVYVTTSRWPQPLPPIEPLPRPEPLPRDLPLPDVLPESAPDTSVAPPSPPTITTEVHRFALDGTGASYAASGSVPGHVLNQWALSEHDGHLRIATTEDATVDTGVSVSAVRILRQHGSRLEEVGHVGDLGRGERIYAVRYAGDVGFVVTFRQVDPLYTLDLSDPTAPRVLGELKIPGYSAYLHPVGDDHLLGVGQDADVQGRVQGVQVSMFDITDLAAPARVGRLQLGPNTSTDVEYDHRALLHWPDRDLVVLPVQRWDHGDAGALVLRAEPTGGLVERGFVRQPSAAGQPATIVRSLVVDDRLLTVSPTGVMASDLETLTSTGQASFD